MKEAHQKIVVVGSTTLTSAFFHVNPPNPLLLAPHPRALFINKYKGKEISFLKIIFTLHFPFFIYPNKRIKICQIFLSFQVFLLKKKFKEIFPH